MHQRVKDLVKVRLLGRIVNGFICVGSGVYRSAMDRGFPRQKLILTHNAVDVDRFNATSLSQEVCRKRLGAAQGQVVYLTLGRNPIIKGVDIFLRAAEDMNRATGTDNLFLILGTKLTHEYVADFKGCAHLNHRFRVLDPTDDFPSLLGGIEVFVAASRTEGFSYAVLEAMAAGKLVLCSDIPGTREIYGNLDGVWLFAPEDWQTLAVLMQKAARLPSKERDDLGRQNSEFVTRHHSLKPWAEDIVKTYVAITDAGDASRPKVLPMN